MSGCWAGCPSTNSTGIAFAKHGLVQMSHNRPACDLIKRGSQHVMACNSDLTSVHWHWMQRTGCAICPYGMHAAALNFLSDEW